MPPIVKHINHELSPMPCPVRLEDVDLFGEGAQEHWYEAYEILHRDAPVLRIPGGGLTPGTDAFVLTKHEDVTTVVKDPARFRVISTMRVRQLADEGLGPEEAYAATRNLMQASMVSLRPTQELYFHHRRELTDPWVGVGASRHRDMITRHANALVDDWIDEGESSSSAASPARSRNGSWPTCSGSRSRTCRCWPSGAMRSSRRSSTGQGSSTS